VKNTLGTVQAIAAQTFRDGPRLERDAFAGRLRALSNAHDMLTRQDWDQVAVRGIIERAIAPFDEDSQARFTLSGVDAILTANQALLLAMAIHELATNAMKYGALSTAAGRVVLCWSIKDSGDGRILRLEWRESGGPEVQPPGRKGFGTTLIERALQQEEGRSCFEFRPDGVVCTLEMKV
jgi:two-component sensor histidine kinase